MGFPRIGYRISISVFMVTLGSGLAHSKSGNAQRGSKIGSDYCSSGALKLVILLLAGYMIEFIGDISIKIIAIIILLFCCSKNIEKNEHRRRVS